MRTGSPILKMRLISAVHVIVHVDRQSICVRIPSFCCARLLVVGLLESSELVGRHFGTHIWGTELSDDPKAAAV